MVNKSYSKYCKKCDSKEVIKFGIKRGKKTYAELGKNKISIKTVQKKLD